MQQQKRVVLLGYVGSGKTSLFNLLTQSNQETKEGGKSVTQRVVIGYSRHLKGFEILDTPGFSFEETVESLSGVLAGLYYGDINRILMVVKYERVKQMMGFIKKMFKKIKQLKDVITIVVTKWDLYDQTQNPNDPDLIKQSIVEYTGITSVIFCANPKETRTSEENSLAICVQIEQILKENNQVISFKATKKVLANLETPDYINNHNMNLACGEIEREFRKISNSYRQFIQNHNSKDPDSFDVMHNLQIYIKQIAADKVDEFVKKFGDNMNEQFDLNSENKQYILFIKLKQAITNDYQLVISMAQQKMQESENSFHSWIKRCPNCNRLWVKVIGCKGQTYCGNRVNNSDIEQSTPQNISRPKRYKFLLENDILICQKIEITNQFDAQKIISQFVIDNNLVQTQILQEAITIVNDQLRKFQQKIIKQIQDLKQIEQEIKINKNNKDEQNQLVKKKDLVFSETLNCLCKIFELENKNLNQFEIITLLFSSIQKEENLIVNKSHFLTATTDQFIQQMTQVKQPKYLSFIKFILQQGYQSQQTQNYSEGCNFSFDWDEQPPISEMELKAIFSPDLLDYITDKVKLEKDETIQYEKELELLNFAIKHKLQQVELLK